MAAILAVLCSSYREGWAGAEEVASAFSVRGSGMWGGVRAVARATSAAAAAEVSANSEKGAGGLKGDTGRLLVDQVCWCNYFLAAEATRYALAVIVLDVTRCDQAGRDALLYSIHRCCNAFF
jgi:hypothetical protein